MKLDNFSYFVRQNIKGLFCAFFLITGVLIPCDALPLTMFPVNDPILDDIRLITSDSAHSLLAFTPPFSRDEIRAVLDETQFDELSPHAKEAYLRVQERLSPVMLRSGSNYALELNVQSSLEAGFRSNNKINWTDADNLPLPILDLPLSIYLKDKIQLTLRSELSKALFNFDAEDNFKHGVPYALGQVDFHFPLTAYLASGGSWWNVQIGRDKLSLGTALTGNLMISDNADYYDFARAQLFSRNFKYSFFITQSPMELDEPFFYKDTATDADTLSVHRYFYLHRLDFRLWNKVSFGITEGLIAGDSPIELRYLNPLMVMHNFFVDDYPRWNGDGKMASSVFSIEVNFALTKRLNLYGQLLIDEFELPTEGGDKKGSGDPNGLAYLAGADYGLPIGNWDSLFFVEFTYTDPYVYVDNGPFTSLVFARRTGRGTGEVGRYLWMGHPSGRDAIVLSFGARFSRNPALRLGFDFSFETHGSHSITWDWGSGASFFAERTPTSPTSQKIVTEVFAEWKPIKKLTLKPRAAIIHASNAFAGGSTSENGVELGLKAVYTY